MKTRTQMKGATETQSKSYEDQAELDADLLFLSSAGGAWVYSVLPFSQNVTLYKGIYILNSQAIENTANKVLDSRKGVMYN